MDTLSYILNRYPDAQGKESPIKLNISRWGSMPKLFKELGFKVGAEIGVAGGRFSKFLCQFGGLRVFAVDAWQIYSGYKDNESQEKMENLYHEARARLRPYNCHFLREWSMNAVKRFADESLDFVFIDANHDYEHAKEDIVEWSKKVKKGGIVSGHDYVNGLHGIVYGVRQAVDEQVREQGISHLFILNKESEYSCPAWMYVK